MRTWIARSAIAFVGIVTLCAAGAAGPRKPGCRAATCHGSTASRRWRSRPTAPTSRMR